MHNDNEESSAASADAGQPSRARGLVAEREDEEAQGINGAARERRRSRRHEEYERHRHGRDPRKKAWIIALSLALGAETFGLIVAYTQAMMVENERRTLAQAIQTESRELKLLQPQFVSLKQEMARQVKSRSPGLRPLLLDQVIPIGQDNVVNIAFAATGKDDSKAWEYKAVMANDSADPIHVRLDLLLFDEGGVQVGRSPFLKNSRKDNADTLLHAGEVRSFHGTAELNHEESPPVYFMLVPRPGRQD